MNVNVYIHLTCRTFSHCQKYFTNTQNQPVSVTHLDVALYVNLYTVSSKPGNFKTIRKYLTYTKGMK